MNKNKMSQKLSATPAPLNPAVTHQAMYNICNFLNQEVNAYDTYTADLERQLRDAEWRAKSMEERANFYRQELDELYPRLSRSRAGGETVVMAIDNMYNLFITMCQQHPEIAHFHDQLQRVVLHAEAGRRMLQPVIDLTESDDDEDDEMTPEDMLEDNGPTYTRITIDLTTETETTLV